MFRFKENYILTYKATTSDLFSMGNGLKLGLTFKHHINKLAGNTET